MADGEFKNNPYKTSFIAYQDEEHGLGYKVAREVGLANGGGRPSRRLSTGDTLSALLSKKADKAIVPLENDLGGYDTSTLSTLLDFKDCVIREERQSTDNYCLAAPAVSIHEIAQSAFPGTFAEKGAVGPFPRDRHAQAAYRKRVEVVYASSDAFERCEATIDELRADGIEVRRIPDGVDPYREVLSIARSELDPNRKVRTQMTDNQHTRVSEASGASFNKALYGVLLPQDVAVGIDNGYNEVTGTAHGVEFNGDYVILQDNLADGNNIHTRFLVVERKPSPKKGGAKPAKSSLPRDQISKKLDSISSDYARILLKLDTRGEKTRNLSDITDILVKNGIHFRPIYLHERPDTLPVVLEIELNCQLGVSKQDRVALGQVWDRAFNKTRNHDPAFLAAYGASRTVFDGVVMPSVRKSQLPMILSVSVGLMAIAAAAAFFFLM